MKRKYTSLDLNDVDFNLCIAENNFTSLRKVNSSIKNGNKLSENRNTDTKGTPQNPLTSKSFSNDPQVVILGNREIPLKLKSC